MASVDIGAPGERANWLRAHSEPACIKGEVRTKTGDKDKPGL